MSHFPRTLLNADPAITSFQPLFRMLDDFDRYRGVGEHTHRSPLKTFSPKFDLREVVGAYELQGELPGIEQKNVDIEFSDSHTLTIKGRTEHSYSSSSTPAGFVEDAPTQGAIEGSGSNGSHKATVEDADESTEVAKKGEQEQTKQPEAKYWVSERSVGSFSRSFTFPDLVDHNGVTASMKNGVLSIHVPKAKKPEARKITIS